MTLESGDTATITYGDENITIQETTITEGDTITNNYTIYYLIDGSGSVTPPCEHDWQEASGTDPTCTLPGKVTLSCTKCQQTKTETLPALGHDWQVKQTVTTQYDDTGQLIHQYAALYDRRGDYVCWRRHWPGLPAPASVRPWREGARNEVRAPPSRHLPV